jgi:hypothetical protein
MIFRRFATQTARKTQKMGRYFSQESSDTQTQSTSSTQSVDKVTAKVKTPKDSQILFRNN